MADLYEKNGVLLLDDNGTSLRGCCCDECAIVEVNLYVSSFSDPTGASTGEGSHASVANVRSAVCSATASCSGTQWPEFESCSDSASCYATNGCGSILARALLTMGDDMTLRAPWMGGGARTNVGYLEFTSSRVVKPGRSMTIDWAGSIKYYSASGGAPNSRTRKPIVTVSLSTGAVYTANGTDTTFSWSDTATGGQTAQNFTATVYLQ